MSKKNIESSVNDVIENLYDSCNGYKECADKIEEPYMQQLFQRLANQRERMIQELKSRAELAGVKPVESGTIAGAAHRTFIDVKSLVTGGDPEAIIKEVKRGEHHTIEQYKEALDEDIPADLKALLSQQMRTIETNLAEIDVQARTSH
ncbi:MAG: aldehyde dehydrogenase [Gammaproteobacteria bacterium]|jgi:uncharacterized protein (TIGR02284 family)|nr:aldehyde dehydrogenase [Gammaproteobacteria bacterium]